jgi:biopolymer transport protein ExbB
MLTHQALERVQEHLQLHPGALAAVWRALLAAPSPDKADLEEVALMHARRELRQLNLRLPTLNPIAGLAPLMGLLETVVGMVKAFQQVAMAEGAVNPALLAQGFAKTHQSGMARRRFMCFCGKVESKA